MLVSDFISVLVYMDVCLKHQRNNGAAQCVKEKAFLGRVNSRGIGVAHFFCILFVGMMRVVLHCAGMWESSAQRATSGL